MTTKKDIPGGFAIFRDTDELRARDRNLVKAAAMAASSAIQKLPESVQEGPKEGETPEDAAVRLEPMMESVNFTWQESLALIELRQASVVAMLQEWSLDKPLPTMETIGDLDPDLYDALDAAIGGVTAVAASVDFDPQPPGENPTGSDLSSSKLSSPEDEAPSLSTPSLPNSGESTPTDASIPV